MTADDWGILASIFVMYLFSSWLVFRHYWKETEHRMRKSNEAALRLSLPPHHKSIDFAALWIAALICTVFWPLIFLWMMFRKWQSSRR